MSGRASTQPEALVLGAGFAGLSAAVHLASAGLRVTLVEQDPAPGGKAGERRRNGFRFDTGPSLFTLPRVLDEVFAAAGRPNPVPLRALDLLCRYRFASGRVWDVFADPQATEAGLRPAEVGAYRSLLREAERLYRAAAPTFVFGPPPGPGALLRFALRHGLRAHPGRSLPQLLAAHGASLERLPELAQFFLRFATYYGADPFRAPAVLHNIAWVELGEGASAPLGGVRAVVEALTELALDLGVQLECGVRVEALPTADGRLTGVRTSAGERRAPLVVSALDRAHTLALLRPRPRQRPALARQAAEPSLSGLVLLLEVAGESAHPHHTISFPADYRAEFAAIRRGEFPADPTLYLAISSKSDPRDAPAGCENWFVMANAPALGPGVDPAAQREREAAAAAGVLSLLHARGLLDGVRVEGRRWLGPSHLARYGHRGAIYGRAPHSLLATLRPPHRLAGVRGLWLAGGTVHPGGGIPLALLSGRGAARAALASRRGRSPG